MISKFYKGIRILWDEDNDKRIYDFINQCVPNEYINFFISIREHEGVVTITFKNNTPEHIIDFFAEKGWEFTSKDGAEDFWVTETISNKTDIRRIISPEARYEVLKQQHWRCNICGVRLKYSKKSKWDGEIAHIDHIWPYSERYSYPKGVEFINEIENLQALCPKCNREKWKRKQ